MSQQDLINDWTWRRRKERNQRWAMVWCLVPWMKLRKMRGRAQDRLSVWTYGVCRPGGLLWWRRGQQKNSKDLTWNHNSISYWLLLLSLGSSPKVGNSTRAAPQSRRALGHNAGELAQSHTRCHGPWDEVSLDSELEVPLWKKLEAITICRLIFSQSIATKSNKDCIFCGSGKQNIYKHCCAFSL